VTGETKVHYGKNKGKKGKKKTAGGGERRGTRTKKLKGNHRVVKKSLGKTNGG